jgi:hypothetical protein
MTNFVNKQGACQYLKLSEATLKRYRLQGLLIEGIHWVRLNSRCIRYNLDLLQDWMRNRHNPEAHQRTIEVYLANLQNNQLIAKNSPKVRKIKPKSFDRSEFPSKT